MVSTTRLELEHLADEYARLLCSEPVRAWLTSGNFAESAAIAAVAPSELIEAARVAQRITTIVGDLPAAALKDALEGTVTAASPT